MARRRKAASRCEFDAIDALLEASGTEGAADFEALTAELKKALAERMLNADLDCEANESQSGAVLRI